MKNIITAGKGGTGKSMILYHLLQRHILKNGFGKVLVVDADPHQSLTHLLGAHPEADLGTLRHTHQLELKTGKGLEKLKRREFAYQLAQEAIVHIPGGDLLVMGHNDEPGCQCVVNHILGSALDAVATEYDLVIVDNEAGIEQIGRHAWPINVLLLMSSPKPLELDVAGQILKRAQETQRRIDTPCLILNRAFDGRDYHAFDKRNLLDEHSNMVVLGSLPYSRKLASSEEPDDVWLAALDTIWIRLDWILENAA